MNPVVTKKLESERLILQRLSLATAPEVFKNWTSDPRVTKYLTWQPHQSVQETEAYLAYCIKKYDTPYYLAWHIYHKDSKQVIGAIDLVKIDERLAMGEIGYCLSPTFWNQGIMSEALHLVIDYCFCQCGFALLQASHDANNIASGLVMRKNGMKWLKEEIIFLNKLNNNINLITYQITREDWQNGKIQTINNDDN